jgi:hypothetical protein
MNKEKRVYVVSVNEEIGIPHQKNNEKIKERAEELGTVYSLKGFQNAFNSEDISIVEDYILID